MPEAIAIVAVSFTAVLIYVIARVQSAKHHPLKDRAHLQQHHDWLVERLLHAEKHNWDEGMREHLANQLEETRERIEKSAAPSKQP
ncbi:MAG TPA: hypothetical protein VFJ90_05595 [Candidatus Didemnitutus sp.]|nr:hypothetical protein [Candidatus Didemnitutus sp.]